MTKFQSSTSELPSERTDVPTDAPLTTGSQTLDSFLGVDRPDLSNEEVNTLVNAVRLGCISHMHSGATRGIHVLDQLAYMFRRFDRVENGEQEWERILRQRELIERIYTFVMLFLEERNDNKMLADFQLSVRDLRIPGTRSPDSALDEIEPQTLNMPKDNRWIALTMRTAITPHPTGHGKSLREARSLSEQEMQALVDLLQNFVENLNILRRKIHVKWLQTFRVECSEDIPPDEEEKTQVRAVHIDLTTYMNRRRSQFGR